MVGVKLIDVIVEYELLSSSRNRFFPSLTSKQKVGGTKRALNSMSLEVMDGQRLGLLGPNGSGKTTLLKLVAGILRPSSGQAIINGTVGSLFSSIPFINNNLSPRENILQYGEFTGLSRGQKASLVEDIEEFAELGEYFDQPLFYGSAGMIARFQFGLLTSKPKDILIVDEGIGAGDQFFVKKAEKRLKDLYSKASILIMASHSTDLLTTFCDRAVILEQGLIVHDNDCVSAVREYQDQLIK